MALNLIFWFRIKRAKCIIQCVHDFRYRVVLSKDGFMLSVLWCCPFTLQRHFSVFAVNFPSSGAQMSIFSQILCGHLKQRLFSPLVQKSALAVVQAAITLHHKMVHSFLPTAVTFHYTFNLRDLSNVFQVVLIVSFFFCNTTFQSKVKNSVNSLFFRACSSLGRTVWKRAPTWHCCGSTSPVECTQTDW